MPQHKTMLPQAGPMPVFQTALKDSRFGFSARDSSSNLTRNVSNQGQHLQVNQFNPTHSNIHDNGNNVEESNSSDEDNDGSNKDGSGSDEDGSSGDENNNNVDNNGNSDENDNNSDIYQDKENGGDMGKWLPKSL